MNRIKPIALLLSIVFLGGMLMTSCDRIPDTSETVSTPVTEVSQPIGERENLALGASYYYDFAFSVDGDPCLNVLTDGDKSTAVTLRTDVKSSADGQYIMNVTDWYGASQKITLDNGTASFTVDLGFVCSIDSFALTFAGESTPEKVKLFSSNDGYNFTSYLGEFNAADGIIGINAKALQFVFEIGSGKELSVTEAEIFGTRSNTKILVSEGATYEWAGVGRKTYPENDERGKLTDGVFFDGENTDLLVGKSGGSIADPITGKKGAVITVDLGEVKNISELSFGAFKTASSTLPDRIDVRYSEDGENWSDLGQSYLRTSDGKNENCSYKYCVTRNHTVPARYVAVYTYSSALLVTDELAVYGCEHSVDEPEYDFNGGEVLSNANIAAHKNVLLNGKAVGALTDMTHTVGTRLASGENEVTVELGSRYDGIVGAMLYCKSGSLKNINVFIDDKKVESTEKSFTLASYTVYRLFFDASAGSTVKITFEGNGTLCETAVYASQTYLPVVNGGFFQVPTSSASNPVAQNSEYSWYLQLKGMRELGMKYVVIQYSVQFTDKTTLVNGKNILAAGYRYAGGYGASDMCEAVLDAADKLGMKVWLGTIHGADFNSPINNKPEYEKLVTDSYAIIKDIKEMYSAHESFAGYYLSDETCDQWLNLKDGVDAARYVYKSQSDYIRSIDPDATTMIAPAIWRSGAAETGADNLYRMLAPETEGGKPTVDIVAAQDCLGRTEELYVTDATYNSFEAYVDEWAKAVRRAGSEFWHDAEVFERVYTTKRYECVVESLEIESKTSGTVIVFDIPHYFSSYPMASYNDVNGYYKRTNMRKYTEYYSQWASMYLPSASQPSVVTDDGKTVADNKNGLAAPVIYDKTFNEGVVVFDTPQINALNSVHLYPFSVANGSGKKPEFAYFTDSEAFYIVLKTNDTTDSFGKGEWWSGKDDLVQIWISGTGERSSDILTLESGIRYYIHRKGASSFETGGECGEKVTYGGFTYEYDKGTFLIKMPWESLGRSAPTEGDGTTICVNIQYIDGADSSWASSAGSTGRGLNDAAAYSFG